MSGLFANIPEKEVEKFVGGFLEEFDDDEEFDCDWPAYTACCVPGEFPSVKAAREASMIEFLNRRHQKGKIAIYDFHKFEREVISGLITEGKIKEDVLLSVIST